MKKALALNRSFVPFIFICVLLVTACESSDPQKEDTPELITKVTLTFSPASGGTIVRATASDPDGEGVKDIEVDGTINLSVGTTYTLTVSLINELAEMSSPEYDITNEVEKEGAEHMFFFAWTGNLFSNPSGDGNLDNRLDFVNYNDEDVAGLPVGIITTWTTGTFSSGKFRVVLKHQPQLKSGTSGADVGETDLDVEFEIIVN